MVDRDDTRYSAGKPHDTVPVVRSGGADRRFSVGIGLVLVAVGLAALKPWGGTSLPADVGVGGIPTARPAAAGASLLVETPAPTARALGLDDPGGQCFPTGWRLFTLQEDVGRSLRSWMSLEPSGAAGPLDRAIPFVRIVADHVFAVGFCVGVGPSELKPISAVGAWSLPESGQPVALELQPLIAYIPSRPDAGAVYRPPGSAASEDEWPAGRYIFVVRYGGSPEDDAWFGLEIVHFEPSQPAPQPESSAPAPRPRNAAP